MHKTNVCSTHLWFSFGSLAPCKTVKTWESMHVQTGEKREAETNTPPADDQPSKGATRLPRHTRARAPNSQGSHATQQDAQAKKGRRTGLHSQSICCDHH